MKTYSIKESEISRNWFVVDAADITLGRLASQIAILLRGKHKPVYTPHMDCGDHVVVINARNVHLSGKKLDKKDGKIYYRHTGYPGGIKSVTAGKLLSGEHPERVIFNAVNRMISRNKLGRQQMKKLHIYSDVTHPHTAQNPDVFDIASKNPKNRKNR